MLITKKVLKKQISKAKERAKIAHKILDSIDKEGVICTCCESSERDGERLWCKKSGGSGMTGCFVRESWPHNEFLFKPIEGILNKKKVANHTVDIE